jgi:dihydroneopterin aldolase
LKNIIRIKKLSFYAYHGVFKQERNVGGKFEADIDIECDFQDAAAHDALQSTVDYEKVYRTVIEISDSQKFHLLESLAMTIVDTLFRKFAAVSAITFRLRKNNPPIGGVVDCVEVEVVKVRSEFESQ